MKLHLKKKKIIWGNLVMFRWVAAKQCGALLHCCLLCGPIISLEHSMSIRVLSVEI